MSKITNSLVDHDFNSGTLVCSLVTKPRIYLFSDGSVTEDGIVVSREFSKIHKITQFVGMLTAGMYLDTLQPSLVQRCIGNGIDCIDQVADLASSLLVEVWEANRDIFKKREVQQQMRVFVFLLGYTLFSEPKLYYLDSVSRPRFTIQSRALFQTPGQYVEIGALVSDDSNDNATALMTKHIQSLINEGNSTIIQNLFLTAFNRTKEEISSRNDHVGGRTFFASIDPKIGFRNIL